MSTEYSVTKGFIKTHPRSAARVLASMDPTDTAAFLQTVPAKDASAVLSQMNVRPASIILKHMDTIAGVQVLSDMSFQDVVSVARLLDIGNRKVLMDQMPRKLSRDVETSLSFPSDTVGANMETTITTMRGDQTAADALAELRQLRRTKSGMVFVIGASKTLRGAVGVADLLQSPAEVPLQDLMNRTVPPLSARARLDAVASLDAWEDYGQLPVLDGQKKLIGALTRKIARQARDRETAILFDGVSLSFAASIANAFLTSFVGLWQLLADVEQPPSNSEQKPLRQGAGDKS